MIKVMNCKKISDAACAVYFFMMRLPKQVKMHQLFFYSSLAFISSKSS